MSLLSELRNWRNNQARIEGVEGYRVLPNACLDALVGALPKNKEELLAIKGIKEAKYQKYGAAILRIIGEQASNSQKGESVFSEEDLPSDAQTEKEGIGEENTDQTLTVSQFLDGLNLELSGMAARVQGEVSSVDERERVVYFTIKDSRDESTLSCLIFRYQYDVSGVKLAIGDEIVVEGAPDIYKPSGRLSFKVGVIELFGEGALKKAYEALKLKFEKEGLFAPERKRILPAFPERIALITSEQGAAIGDFTMNLGAQGLHVDFFPTSVEGKKAVFEIIGAVRFFNQHPKMYDILVIIRGGGSLESLQAFNNEALVREVAESRIPTLLGIGHEKDVTLAALVADVMVSTPTATARTLRAPWDEARASVLHTERYLLQAYENVLLVTEHGLQNFSQVLLDKLNQFTERFHMLREQFLQSVPKITYRVREIGQFLSRLNGELEKHFMRTVDETKGKLHEIEETLRRYDPKRALALGYSLIQKEGKIVRNVTDVKKGDILSLRLAKGRLDSEVTAVYNE